jgi:hypothetical protein
MAEQDLGEATIVYEDPEDGTVERTVQNEHVAYFQEHWLIKTGEDEQGRDTVRRVPRERVYHVERTVEAFEEEVAGVADHLRSFTDDVRELLPVGGEGGRARRRQDRRDDGPVEIEVEDGAEGETGAGSSDDT